MGRWSSSMSGSFGKTIGSGKLCNRAEVRRGALEPELPEWVRGGSRHDIRGTSAYRSLADLAWDRSGSWLFDMSSHWHTPSLVPQRLTPRPTLSTCKDDVASDIYWHSTSTTNCRHQHWAENLQELSRGSRQRPIGEMKNADAALYRWPQGPDREPTSEGWRQR